MGRPSRLVALHKPLPRHWPQTRRPFPQPELLLWPSEDGKRGRPQLSERDPMKRETIAIHVGYDGDPITKAVAVPIYQTVAFEFDSAEHGAALFNLEVQGNIYTRIGNPTNTVLEKRVAALEGGVEALSVSSGMSAIHYSLVNIAEAGNNIVSLPQLYGATYTLLAHILPKQGICGRFADSDHPDAVERLIDENTRAVFCESVGNPEIGRAS